MKTFYDPHPGFMGAAINLPEEIKVAIQEFDGKQTSVEEVVATLQKIADKLVESKEFDKAEVKDGNNYISLWLIEGEKGHKSVLSSTYCSKGCQHSFRLISYRDLP